MNDDVTDGRRTPSPLGEQIAVFTEGLDTGRRRYCNINVRVYFYFFDIVRHDGEESLLDDLKGQGFAE